ncbi:MAG: hypothetical protein IT371_17725 [Deltaproteobacteria bacterium]|nr:hypothetical protein [Deltaproteobacteria bacterium]
MSSLRAVLLICAILHLPFSSVAEAQSNPHFERGMKLLREMDEGKALKEFAKALGYPGTTSQLKARIHIYRGVAFFHLLDKKSAQQAFQAALTLDPQVQIPRTVSPKIRVFFDRLKQQLSPPDAEVIGDDGGRKPSGGGSASGRGRGEDDDDDDDDRGSRRGSAGSGSGGGGDEQSRPDPDPDRPPARTPDSRPGANWAAWTSLGLGGLALAIGIGLGVASRKDQAQADDPTLPYDDAFAYANAASKKALGANILFGVAGAGAVAAVVLFIVRRGRPRSRSVSIAPLRGGAMVQMVGVTW